ncbi:MAG: GNAT family N-acetyltransferase, partial [Novosphingobium sp.]|nr:GNAT family N-acetyltransferase [Novosphingobium sp.]
NLARVPWPYTQDHARDFTRREQDRMLPSFLITLPTARGSEIIGSAGLGQDGGHVELGYWIARKHWGKGYASEAARAVLRLAYALGHRRLTAGHFADNAVSGRVLHKAGFRPTGEAGERYSLGRGCDAPSVEYAVDLGCKCGGDDGEDRDGPFDRMAA